MEHSNTVGVTQSERTDPPPGRESGFRVLGHTAAECTHKGGTSSEVKSAGFQPAFLDYETGRIFRACFANGLPAPMHILDGFPDDMVVARDASGRITAVKRSMIPGFVRCGRFFTRAQAAQIVNEANHH